MSCPFTYGNDSTMSDKSVSIRCYEFYVKNVSVWLTVNLQDLSSTISTSKYVPSPKVYIPTPNVGPEVTPDKVVPSSVIAKLLANCAVGARNMDLSALTVSCVLTLVCYFIVV